MMTRLTGRPVYIVDGARTPFLKAAGQPGPFHAADLAVACGSILLARQPFSPDALDEVIVGCVAPTVDEANIARIIALRIGCDKQVPAFTVQRNCASGMQSLDTAALEIATGRADIILAGGTEAMSHSPVVFNEKMAAWLGAWTGSRSLMQRLAVLSQFRPSLLAPVIGLLRGLTDPVTGLSMGQTAENLAWRFNISREQMDAFALHSHQRLARAQDEGFLDEIVTLIDQRGNIHESDDGLRRDSSMERLAKLRPVFDKRYGNITAGNSAQITDGACLLILASEEAVQQHELQIMGRLVDSQWAGLDPAQMGLGPVHATTPILQRQNLTLDDIDIWEINEAFAAQVLACVAAWEEKAYCQQQLGLDDVMGTLDQEKLNLDGGGISLGHPVGASGARITLHALKALHRKNKQRAIATLCIGGGQGGAVMIERE
ncbi:MAG: acetyl-CoA C-acetyltransferase [Gammaproteobacteria bacterium]|nr:MAG: acetyl-CoA C-acetyltransferase [Gammaproteobacteria bacterium]